MSIDSTSDSTLWAALDLASLAERAAGAALRHLSLDAEVCEISLLATDDAAIAELNGEFRGKPQPTNVLSWPAQDLGAQIAGAAPAAPQADSFGDIALGDIALAFETCAAEAERAGKPLADHVTHLIVHGVLHLLGYDHVRDADATLMEGLEAAILGRLGMDDPYRVDEGP